MAKKAKSKIKTDEELPESETQDEADERAIKHVYSCKKESLDFYEEKFRTFNYFDRLYIRGAAKTNVPYGRANLELPLAFQQVEPYVDNMTSIMVGEAPYISYEGRNADDEEPAQDITDFTQYQLDCGGFIEAWLSWIRNLGKYGTAVMKCNWETDIITVEEDEDQPVISQMPHPTEPGKTVPIISGIKTVKVENDMTEHDGPVFYNLSLFDFFVPRSASGPNVQKMEWVIHRTYRTIEDLLANPNYKSAHKKLKKIIDEEANDDEKDVNINPGNVRESSKRIEMDQKNPSKGNKKYLGKIEVLEWWGDWKFKKKDEQGSPALIVIAVIEDEKILLRADENPMKFKFKPFIMANDYPIEGEPYGYGELHHIKGLIEESTALRNARLDVANMSLNRMWLVERQAGVNLRELYSSPNKIILTNDNNGIKALDMGQVTPSSVQDLARIDFDIQNTTNVINPRQDVSNVGAAFGSTATGVNFLAGKTNGRLVTKARLLEQTFFKPLAKMLNWYNRDFITDEMYYRVAGEEHKNPYRSISPDAFLTAVDFKPTSNPDKPSRGEQKENMGYFLQTVGQIMKVRPNVNIKVEEIVRDIAKLSGFPHPDKYIGPVQTTVLQTPNGQVVDTSGQPVNVVPVDETGQPLQAGPAGPAQ